MSALQWLSAHFYQQEQDRLRCTLCPHRCALKDGDTGRCFVRRRRGNRLETAAFSTVVRHLHPIERKPFYHFLPGSKVLTLAPPGCTFACTYCQNFRISQVGRDKRATVSSEIVDPETTVEAARSVGAHLALSYSEPTLAAELTLALAREAHKNGVEIVWKSNGFITPEALAQLSPSVSAINLDLKSCNSRAHHRLTGAFVEPVLEALALWVKSGTWVEVSTPLIPGFNDDDASVAEMAEFVAGLGMDIPWHLLRFHPDYRLRAAPPTSPELLARALQVARSVGLKYVYVERALGEPGRTTLCAVCGERLISRGLEGGAQLHFSGSVCPRCGTPVAGVWKGVSS